MSEQTVSSPPTPPASDQPSVTTLTPFARRPSQAGAAQFSPQILAQIQPVAQLMAIQNLIGQAIAAQSKKDEQEYDLKKHEGERQLEVMRLQHNADWHSKCCSRAVAVIISVVALGLCWIFLHYGRPEFVVSILAAVADLARAFGLRP